MPELLHPGVYVQELPPTVRPIQGVSTSTTAFVGVADKGPVAGRPGPNGREAHPRMVTSFDEYQRIFGGFRVDSFLTYAVRSFFENGGRRLYIIRVVADDAQSAVGRVSTLDISASSAGAWGKRISVAVAASPTNEPNHFDVNVYYSREMYPGGPTQDQHVETFANLTHMTTGSAPPPNYVRTVINSRSEYIVIQNDVSAAVAPAGRTALNGSGSDGTRQIDYIGSASDTGLHALDGVTDVNLIAIPGQGDPATLNAGMEYCKNRGLQDCFFIGDAGAMDGGVPAARGSNPGTSINSVADATSLATGGTSPVLDRSFGDYGGIYYPWVWASDPLATASGGGVAPRILLPPSGFVAGIYARIDNARGVFKAPAGTEAGVAGALTTAEIVGDRQQDTLNPVNVNAIRTVPGSGIVIWGARTIGSDPGWRYIPVRRMAIFLRVSIYYGIQWAVFEPNDEPLWSALRINIRAFMLTQFRGGAFQGSKPDDAFFVRCDGNTTTQQDIDNGVVNILVGFAPLKPAEFVVLKLSQKLQDPAALGA